MTAGRDLLASFVVFLIALPLCMGVAVASGAPPAAGLITGIVGGVLVGALSGSPLQVSGPAAGLTVVVWEILRQHGAGGLAVALMVAGALQMGAGVLRVGQWFRAVAPSVVHGMLAGIGVLIFASQVFVVVDDTPRGSGLDNLRALPEALAGAHPQAALLGGITLGALLLWKLLRPRRLAFLPETLVGVVAATVTNAFAEFPVKHVLVPDNLLSAIRVPSLDDFAHLGDSSLLVAALTLAFVASAETLLSAVAIDRMHSGERTRYDRELFAQGVGNVTCGALGALPMTGVIARSGANVGAGARTRLSTILHGTWILLFVVFLPGVLAHIPMASLGAVLVYNGFKLIDIGAIRELRRFGRSEVFIFLATLVISVVAGLLTGVLVGIGIAVGKMVLTMLHLEVDVVHGEPGSVRIHLRGSASFLGLPKLAAALESVPPGSQVHILIEALAHIDHAALDLLGGFEERHRATGGTVVLEWRALEARIARMPHAAEKEEPDAR
jgi:MFS superfamily sulfate permease-like transporter